MSDFLPDKEMIDQYLERRQIELVELQRDLTAGSLSAFRRVGHQLAGNALSFGFPFLARLGRKMETMTEQNLSSTGAEVLAQYRWWLNQIRK